MLEYDCPLCERERIGWVENSPIDDTYDYVNELEQENKHLRELLREGLEATKHADGHWSDRVRWMNWVAKVERELADAVGSQNG